jgi:hypothetical protein
LASDSAAGNSKLRAQCYFATAMAVRSFLRRRWIGGIAFQKHFAAVSDEASSRSSGPRFVRARYCGVDLR